MIAARDEITAPCRSHARTVFSQQVQGQLIQLNTSGAAIGKQPFVILDLGGSSDPIWQQLPPVIDSYYGAVIVDKPDPDEVEHCMMPFLDPLEHWVHTERITHALVEFDFYDQDHASEATFRASEFGNRHTWVLRLHFGQIDSASPDGLPFDFPPTFSKYAGHIVVSLPGPKLVRALFAKDDVLDYQFRLSPERLKGGDVDPVFAAAKEEFSFFGGAQTIRGLPYVGQDEDDSYLACGHVAVWNTLRVHHSRGRSGTRPLSGEIVRIMDGDASGSRTDIRATNHHQLDHCFAHFGLRPVVHFIDEIVERTIRGITDEPSTWLCSCKSNKSTARGCPYFRMRAVIRHFCAYLNSDYPVVMFDEPSDAEGHAATIYGYRRETTDDGDQYLKYTLSFGGDKSYVFDLSVGPDECKNADHAVPNTDGSQNGSAPESASDARMRWASKLITAPKSGGAILVPTPEDLVAPGHQVELMFRDEWSSVSDPNPGQDRKPERLTDAIKDAQREIDWCDCTTCQASDFSAYDMKTSLRRSRTVKTSLRDELTSLAGQSPGDWIERGVNFLLEGAPEFLWEIRVVRPLHCMKKSSQDESVFARFYFNTTVPRSHGRFHGWHLEAPKRQKTNHTQ